MAEQNKKTVNFLPDYLKTVKNEKFLSATLDQLIQSPDLERVDGYVGSKITSLYNPVKDTYISETESIRSNYQVEPGLVFKNASGEINDVKGYIDLLSAIKNNGGQVNDLDELLRTKHYSFDPLIDWDKLINYDQYYWLPNGPSAIVLDLETSPFTEIIGNMSYDLPNGPPLSNGMKLMFTQTWVQGQNSLTSSTQYLVEGVGKSIKLIDLKDLEVSGDISSAFNETFDNTDFDTVGFDSDKKTASVPEYYTINRASADLNPWTRYNRWFHKSVIEATAEYNKEDLSIDYESRAKRPILEYKADLQLFNFGSKSIQNIDVIDDSTVEPFSEIEGSVGYYIDQVLLQSGYRVIFNNANDPEVRSKVYVVNFTTTTNTIELVSSNEFINDLDSVSVNNGTKYSGKSFYFKESSFKWIYAQQHTYLNQPPLFDVLDETGTSVSESGFENNFKGTRIFGYEETTGTPDSVLGVAIKQTTTPLGIGSFVFKTYFNTDSFDYVKNNISYKTKISGYYLKINNPDNGTYFLNNIWVSGIWSQTTELDLNGDYFYIDNFTVIPEIPSPIIETKLLSENTSSVKVQSLRNVSTVTSVDTFVNNILTSSTFTITNNEIIVNFNSTLSQNSFVSLNIVGEGKLDEELGYYSTPLSLNSNPINEDLVSLTLTQLSDHLKSMVSRDSRFVGNFPGTSNLRDLNNYSIQGDKLIVNDNPISFALMFLTKKEHDLIESLRFGANQYNQWKYNFIRELSNIDTQSSPREMLDAVLLNMSQSKSNRDSYYKSDMLGYGSDKTVRTITVTNLSYSEYYLGEEFDLNSLSYRSILVYKNGIQLIHGLNYEFVLSSNSVKFLTSLDVNDLIEFVVYNTTVGCYIPQTPSKLGLYPAYTPSIVSDGNYAGNPKDVIIGHDGSRTAVFNDYRDDIIFEYEKRVYNNIKVKYNRNLFDIFSILPGINRTTSDYDQLFNSLLEKEYSKWAATYNVDVVSNITYDPANFKTWNLTGGKESKYNKPIKGTIRSVNKYYFDSLSMETTPWEMLGFHEKPSWWEGLYGLPPYSSTLSSVWPDITNGYIASGEYKGTWPKYARPQFNTLYNPVDFAGVNQWLNYLSLSGPSDRKADWTFGDYSPAEVAFRNSSFYPFALSVVACLLKPADYTSKLFDLSRVKLNYLKQAIISDQYCYLNPRKVLVEGVNTEQTAGYINLIIERGDRLFQDYRNSLAQDLSYCDLNLLYKVGGFTSKEKIQLKIDAVDPESTSPGVVIPYEDYELRLSTSVPIKSSRISGIIVQKKNGKFLIKGYDRQNTYFTVYQPLKNNVMSSITVGGKTEPYTVWQPVFSDGNVGLTSIDIAGSSSGKFYKQGQIVFYSNKYYRVKVAHSAGTKFNSEYFQQLPALPTKGGVTVSTTKKFDTLETKVPYGTLLSSVQEVYDLIIGYGAWLESQGFIFDKSLSELNEILNWYFTGKEFLYWSTQNWADGNLITLSPFASYLKYQSNNSIVDNLFSKGYEYSLQNADGLSFPKDGFDIYRFDNACVIETKNTEDGIFFAVLNSVQKEHVIVFNNTTVFNDTIFEKVTGYRQKRIKYTGFRTKNWNGDLTSPGFVYDNVQIETWKENKSYIPGSVVRFNGQYFQANQSIVNEIAFDFQKWTFLSKKPISGLLPNFDYKINQFEDFYSVDIDSFDTKQQELSQHLIGYTPRPYLNKIIIDPVAQYKFYQGFIREKGTKNVIDKILKVSNNENQESIDVKEEWAIRVGSYGSDQTFSELEVQLREGLNIENPYVVKFGNTNQNESKLIHYVQPREILIKPDNFNPSSVFKNRTGTYNDSGNILLTAGYVHPDDIDLTAYNKNSLLDIANIQNLKNGTVIWLGFLENGEWDVYRYNSQQAKVTGVFVSNPGSSITFVTDIHHSLKVGDIISVVRFNRQVDGVYIVKNIPNINQFEVASSLVGIINESILTFGSIFRFEPSRISSLDNFVELENLFNLPFGSKVWIDNDENSKWAVYEKTDNYSSSTEFKSFSKPLGQNYGRSIYARDDDLTVLVSSPGYHVAGSLNYGKVSVFRKTANTQNITNNFDYFLNAGQNYCAVNTTTDFGFSLVHDIGKDLFIVGAPAASNVRASIDSNQKITTATNALSPRTNQTEGLVKISTRNQANVSEVAKVVIAQPFTNTTTMQNSRFGHSIYINQVPSTSSTTVLIGAPGNSAYQSTGSVYVYKLSLQNGNVNLGYFYNTSTVNVLSTTSVVMNAGARWGDSIAGSKTGDVIAISAPKYFYRGNKGIVQLFDSNLNWFQTLNSPFGNDDQFGYSISVSNSGTFVFVSSILSQSTFGTEGKVAVYKKLDNQQQYSLSQIITNPIRNSDLKFGESIAISEDETSLYISSLGTNKSEFVKFYKNKNTEEQETTFDSDKTRFVSSIKDSGTVHAYSNFNGKFVQGSEIVPVNLEPNGRYGLSLAATNRSLFVGAPQSKVKSYTSDNSKFYQFKLLGNTNIWKKIRSQESSVDIELFRRISLIDNQQEELIDYLDIYDPLKGKIPGIAEQELNYKFVTDPAVYSVGMAGTTNDTQTNWIDDHVGELWWDLSTAKYVWYNQDNEIFKKNNWGKLFPGASIDIYEWVKSDLLPSEWAVLADTAGGLAIGISGQPKYPDNSVLSVKQVFNTVTGSFENVYFFWVKNKTILPKNANRRLTAYQVAALISDPLANGVKFIEFLSDNSFALGNVQNRLIGNRISVNIAYDKINNKIPLHTEWMLIGEGDSTTLPNDQINKKLIDSLLGRDNLGNKVPDPSLSFRNRYGLGIRPQQTLFADRFAALRNIIDFANSVLEKNLITGIYNFQNLNSVDPIPDDSQGEYDFLLTDVEEITAIDTEIFVKAQVSCTVKDGIIVSTNIINAGYGYATAPKITITPNPNNKAVISTIIDNQGRVIRCVIENAGFNFSKSPSLAVRNHSALVSVDSNSNGRWALYEFNYNGQWNKIKTQLFNTTLYWDYLDWSSESFDSLKTPSIIIDNVYQLSSLSLEVSNYVKVKNIGDGRAVILERVVSNGNFSNEFDIVFSQNGTLKISDNLWNSENSKFTFASSSLDETLYDQLPDIELYNILIALKDDIFTNELKVNWNLLFFKAVKYALTEQKILDWAFKTSYINITNNSGELDQPFNFRIDNNQYYQDYFTEVKPYRTKIRNYTAGYSYIEDARLLTSDFDVSPYYNPLSEKYESLNIPYTGQSSLLSQYPYKTWYDNSTYYVSEIVVGYGGKGYTSVPEVYVYSNGNVVRTATAKAYLKNNKVWKIIVTDQGEGYYDTPTISLRGGNPIEEAKASAIIKNDTTRKNIITMKFDRYSRKGEIENTEVTYTIICDGINSEFELPYLANTDKLTIFPTLDRKLILSSDYKIVNFSKTDNTLQKNYSKFVFVDRIPKSGQLLKIVYQKDLSYYNAIDRIENFYQPTETMAGKDLNLLMTGLEYPNLRIKGMDFSYSSAYNIGTTGSYGMSLGWGDLTNSYSKSRLVEPATMSTNTLYLNTVEDIRIGHSLNFLNTSQFIVRTDTVVQAIDISNNIVTISRPTYTASVAISTTTAIGTEILVSTVNEFRGAIRQNDTVELTGFSPNEFNGTYTITTIYDNNSFIVTASQVLSTTTSIVGSGTIIVYSLLQNIDVRNRKIGEYSFHVGPCKFPVYTIEKSMGFISEGRTVTFTVDGTDVLFGQGRTFEYEITGTNILASDFTDNTLTGLASVLSLPINFTKTLATDNDLGVETFTVNIFTYFTSGTANTSVVTSTSVTILPYDPALPTVYTITASTSTVQEGESVTLTLDGTNVDFGDTGRAFRLTATGTNITAGDLIANTLTSEVVILDQLPITVSAGFALDNLIEGIERVYFNIQTWLNGAAENTATVANTYVEIIDVEQSATYEFFDTPSTISEGSTLILKLRTQNKSVGSQVGFSLSTQTGDFTVADLTTSTLFGKFIMTDGAPTYPGYQIGTYTYVVAQDAASTGYEIAEKFRVTINENTATYIDITITDQIQSSFGQYGSKLSSFTSNSYPAFTQVRIKSTGTFDLQIEQGQYAVYPSGFSPASILTDKWTDNITGTSGYYVRARMEPTGSQWLGNIQFTGPGFATVINAASLTASNYAPVQGNWELINAADSYTNANGNYGWYCFAQYDPIQDVSAYAEFTIVIEISKTNGGDIIASGSYLCSLGSVGTISVPPGRITGGSSGNTLYPNQLN